MIYNAFGDNFYIRGPEINAFNNFIWICYPWFMPLLFVIAGISTSYALKKRSVKQYVQERFFKLFIPLLFGLFLYIPAQTYFAERFHNQYEGGYLNQYLLFFTKPTDLTGYTGGFSPGHLWFIFFLFMISIISLPIMIKYNKSSHPIDGNKLTLPIIIPMFLIPLIMAPILDFGGKSVGQYLALFLLGFFILSEDTVLQRLENNRWWLFTVAVLLIILHLIIFYKDLYSGILFDIFHRFIMWICILAILGIGKHFLNFSNPVTAYLSKSSFPIYFFHQTWVVITAFYVFRITSNSNVQFMLIIPISILLTFLNYEIFRRIPITRFMFGIKA
jgi:hypothetical protein